MPVIGILGGQFAETYAPFLEPFRLGLNDAGYREGHNLAIETRWAQGRYDRLPDLADVLGKVGCTDPAILAHCRSGGEHVRGCWIVDALTGQE